MRGVVSGASLLLLLTTAAGLLLIAPPAPKVLRAGTSWRCLISRGEVRTHRLELSAGQFARVEVLQQDIDLSLSLTKPDGTRLPAMNGSEWGTEALSVLADVSGTYCIEVAAVEEDSAHGSYSITVTEIRATTPDDRKGEQAQSVFAEGMRELIEGTTESMARAMRAFDEARTLWRAAGDRRREAQTLNRLGFAYQRVGQFDRAVDSFQSALAIWQELRDDCGLAEIWPQLSNASGQLSTEVKIPPKSEQLRLWRRLGDRRGEAMTLSRIASEAWASGDYTSAAEYETKALTLREALGDRAEVAFSVEDLARLQLGLKHFDEALEFGLQALRLNHEIGNERGEAACLALVGDIHRQAGEWREAIGYLKQSLQLRRMQGDRSAEAATLNEMAIVELKRGNLTPALAYTKEAVGIEESLAASMNAPNWRTGFLGHRFYVDVEIQVLMALADQHPQSEYAAEALLLADSRRARFLRDHMVAHPSRLSLSDLRRQLGDNTLLLEYWLGEERGYLWALTSRDFVFYPLPERETIERAGRQLLELLTARNQKIDGENNYARLARIEQADTRYATVATAFAKMLLGPVVSELGHKRILLINDGVLEYLPFAALPDPSRSRATPLVENHEIMSVPSVTAFITLDHKHGRGRNPSHLLAVLADPVFDNHDARLGRTNNQRETPLEPGLLRAASAVRLASGIGIPRLPFARAEAQGILGLLPPEQATPFLDFDAGRDTFLSGRLDDYRIIHVITHGFVNSEDPDLSGLVLSLVDKEGHPRDGFLRVRDIYELDISADLVVLSACQTALGKDIRGEGVIGLTSAFLHAGAARVVSSAWKVDDEATAELMREFYRAMLAGRRPSPAVALREAQRLIARCDRWRSPYYWAGFLMQGEWR